MQDDLFLLFVLKAHNVSKRVFTYNVYICFVGSRFFVSQQTDSLHGRPINKLGKSNIRVILFCMVWTIQKEYPGPNARVLYIYLYFPGRTQLNADSLLI